MLSLAVPAEKSTSSLSTVWFSSAHIDRVSTPFPVNCEKSSFACIGFVIAFPPWFAFSSFRLFRLNDNRAHALRAARDAQPPSERESNHSAEGRTYPLLGERSSHVGVMIVERRDGRGTVAPPLPDVHRPALHRLDAPVDRHSV